MNIVEILKNCPEGTKLYSPIFGECTLKCVDSDCDDESYPIEVHTIVGSMLFTNDGKYVKYGAECMLFPSKENRDWNNFRCKMGFKAGDVVTFENLYHGQTLKQTGIVKEYVGQDSDGLYFCNLHCGLNRKGEFIKSGMFGGTEMRPATDEEKQKLLDAIRKNGYEWDAEKLELTKIEMPEFKNGDFIIVMLKGEFQIGIVKEYLGQYDIRRMCTVHCMLDWYGDFKVDYKMAFRDNIHSVRVCTEEEKHILLKVIDENGYEWDAEKLELRKIENYKFNICNIVRSKNNTNNIYQILDIFEDEDSVLTYKCKVLSPNKGKLLNIQVGKMDEWGELVSAEEFEKKEHVFKPFDRVLVRDDINDKWEIELFSHVDDKYVSSFFCTGGNQYLQCIPYEGNEKLLGTTDKPERL